MLLNSLKQSAENLIKSRAHKHVHVINCKKGGATGFKVLKVIQIPGGWIGLYRLKRHNGWDPTGYTVHLSDKRVKENYDNHTTILL